MKEAQREELRERLVASTGEHPAVFGAAEVAFLLSGLDIAEERCIKSLETILKFYLDCGSSEEAAGFDWVDWAEDAEDALATWQAWKANLHSGP